MRITQDWKKRDVDDASPPLIKGGQGRSAREITPDLFVAGVWIVVVGGIAAAALIARWLR